MSIVGQRLTADEYLAIDDEQRWIQLIEGVVVVNEPTVLHQEALMRIAFALRSCTEALPDRGLVTLSLDVRMDDRNVYAPDIMWWAPGNVPGIDLPRPQTIPNLAVEIRSPSTWRYDVGTKRRVYEERGLPELWLVDTAADSVLMFRRSAPAATGFDIALELGVNEALSSPALEGFRLPVAELFARA
jgi:Uma2 family endonuclease